MSLTFKSASQIATDYLTYLKGIKPEVDTSRTDSDWWVRSQVVGGVIAGVYADQALISNDAFPQNARREALQNHLFTWFGNANFNPASQSDGNVIVTGSSGSTVSVGTPLTYQPNQNGYVATEQITLTASIGGGNASGLLPVSSVGVGQSQNLLPGASLIFPSPPAGVVATVLVDALGLADGRDEETEDEAAARILTRIRQRIRGGSISDFQQWAFEASGEVTTANVLRYPFGFGTVAVVITAGTTNIDAALNAGQPIIVSPSAALIATVLAYINSVREVTDCASVFGAIESPIDVTVKAAFVNGNVSTLITDPLNSPAQITQGDMVAREVERAIYKTGAGGRQINGVGYVIKGDLEYTIDQNLAGAGPAFPGQFAQIVVDRDVLDLSASGADIAISGIQVPIPGSITVLDM
jgi:uncharacterized phage protein gp47/JayE